MEWLSEDIHRGQTVLTCIAFAITVVLIWFGRKRLLITIPCALVFLFLAAIAIPNFIPVRPMAHRNVCINNLQQIRDAKIEWARTNHKLTTNVPTEEDLYGTNGANGFLRHKLICPDGGQYTFGAVSEDPRCSLAEHGHKLP
jgi:hypothetical protein